MTGQTVSAVHSEADAQKQRDEVWLRERFTMNAIALYAQTCVGFSLYLYDHVSTPGWISLLLLVPYAALQLYFGKALARRANPGEDPVVSAAGKKSAKLFYLLFSFVQLTNGLVSFYALCAMIRDVMPEHSAWEGALLIAFTCICSLRHGKSRALPYLGSVFKWLVGLLLLYCFLIALPHGKPSHFFPLLGNGSESILKGAWWMSGALSASAFPFLSVPTDKRVFFVSKSRYAFRSVFIALLLAWLTYAVSVWLLPFYAMAKPQTLGWRILLVTHMTPSIPAWSMEVIGLMLLLLFSLNVSVSDAAFMISRGIGSKSEPPFLTPFLILLLIPAGIFDSPSFRQSLLLLLPWRGWIAFCLLFVLFISSFLRKRIQKEENA